MARSGKPNAHTLNIIFASMILCSVAVAEAAQAQAPATMPVAQVVNAANAFLGTLTKQQKSSALFAFTDDAQRRRWSNLPTGVFQRAGLKLGDLTPAQRTAAMNVLAATLSKKGYTKIQQIMDADEVLAKLKHAPTGPHA